MSSSVVHAGPPLYKIKKKNLRIIILKILFSNKLVNNGFMIMWNIYFQIIRMFLVNEYLYLM